jgi:hypothetical protein
MKQLVCNYAPVRFLPYRDVGEFVNVGVVVHCPQTDFFGYRLVPLKRTARVTGFFPELDAKLFKAALQGIARELSRVYASHRPLPTTEQVAPEIARQQVQRFLEVIRRREGLLHFGDAGTLMADAPEEALEALFGRFVERQFAQKREYQEIVMRNRLAHFLRDWKLAQHYEVNKPVGDADFHVIMPFVHYSGDVAAKVIKPLDLNKVETSEIYHHGGAWVKNMERLKNRNHLPPAVVFTVRFPDTGKHLMAAEEICTELRQLGVEPVEFDNPSRLRNAVELDIAA